MATIPPSQLSQSAPLWISLSTGLWTLLLLRVVRRTSLEHCFWLGPLLGVLNSGTACALSSVSESSDLLQVGGAFLLGLLFGSFAGAFLGLIFGGTIAAILWRMGKWEQSGELDASLRLFGSASVVFAGIATLCFALQGSIPDHYRHWQLPPQVALLIANMLVLNTVIQYGRVAIWLRSMGTGYALDNGVLTWCDASRGPFRGGRHTLGTLRTPAHYAVRSVLFALLLGTEMSLWML